MIGLITQNAYTSMYIVSLHIYVKANTFVTYDYFCKLIRKTLEIIILNLNAKSRQNSSSKKPCCKIVLNRRLILKPFHSIGNKITNVGKSISILKPM